MESFKIYLVVESDLDTQDDAVNGIVSNYFDLPM